jgi:hypothetical protein
MMNHVRTLIKEDRGAITADWVTLAGGVLVLTLVLVGAVQQDMTMRIATMQPAFAATSTFD